MPPLNFITELSFLRLQSGKIDLFLRGQPEHLHEDWLMKSLPIELSSVTVSHFLQDQKESYFNLLNNFDVGIGLALVYLVSICGILLVAFLINEITQRIRLGERRIEMGGRIEIRKRIASAVSSFGATRLSPIGLFLLFVGLFFWFSELFLTNNIKVEV